MLRTCEAVEIGPVAMRLLEGLIGHPLDAEALNRLIDGDDGETGEPEQAAEAQPDAYDRRGKESPHHLSALVG